MCSDPNQYWLGDATCSCAYQNGRYSDAVSGTCGTGTVFVNSRTGQEDVTVTNYGMTLFLESDPTTRNHVCRLINQGPGSVRRFPLALARASILSLTAANDARRTA